MSKAKNKTKDKSSSKSFLFSSTGIKKVFNNYKKNKEKKK